MEQNKPDSSFDLQVDHESRNAFKQSAKWSQFIAVIYIICFGFLVIIGMVTVPALLQPDSALNNQFKEMQGAKPNTLTLLRVAALAIFMIYAGLMAVRFATYARRGVEMQDQQSFNHGLKGLRNYIIAGAIYAIWGLSTQVYEVINLFI
jgi:hypothetical protein